MATTEHSAEDVIATGAALISGVLNILRNVLDTADANGGVIPPEVAADARRTIALMESFRIRERQ